MMPMPRYAMMLMLLPPFAAADADVAISLALRDIVTPIAAMLMSIFRRHYTPRRYAISHYRLRIDDYLPF